MASKAETLVDPFSTTFNTSLWLSGSTYTVTGGHLVITTTQNATHGPDSVNQYDLTGSFASIQLVTFAQDTGYTDTLALAIGQYGAEQNSYYIFASYTGGLATLVFRETVNSVNNDTSITYNATQHQWLRFREYNGTVYWDTSPDGYNWVNQRTKTNGGVTLTTCEFHIQAYSTAPSPGSQIVGNFNNEPARAALANTWVDGNLLDATNYDQLVSQCNASLTVVGSYQDPIQNAALPRPTGLGAVYWICALGITPSNALKGDIIFNSST